MFRMKWNILKQFTTHLGCLQRITKEYLIHVMNFKEVGYFEVNEARV